MGIRRLDYKKDMDLGDQLLYERWRNLLLWRSFVAAMIVAILALSSLLFVASLYFDITARQDQSKQRGCTALVELQVSHSDLERLGC